MYFNATGKAAVGSWKIVTATGYMKIPKTILSCFTGKWVIKVDNGFIQSNPKYIAQNHIEYGKYCYDIALTDVNATIRQTCMNALKPEATINKKKYNLETKVRYS